MQKPKHLSDKSKRQWERIVEENTFDEAGFQLLTRYFECADRLDAVREAIGSELTVLDRYKRSVPNPLLKNEHDLVNSLARLWRLLGFDVERAEEDQK